MMSFLCLAFPTTIFCVFGKTHPERALRFSLFLSMQHPFGIFSFERRAIRGSYSSWGVCLSCAWSWSTHGQFSPWKQYETIMISLGAEKVYNYFNYNYVGCILNLVPTACQIFDSAFEGIFGCWDWKSGGSLSCLERQPAQHCPTARCLGWRDCVGCSWDVLAARAFSILKRGKKRRPQKDSKLITETPGV